MHLFFLLPLTTGIIALYISRTSAGKIVPVADLVAVFSLLVSLVSAPWEVQLLILAIAIGGTRFRLRPPASKGQPEAEQGSTVDTAIKAVPDRGDGLDSTTKYRGVSYTPVTTDPASVAAATEDGGAIAGKYRGTAWSTSPSAKPNTNLQSTFALKYRGVPITSQDPNTDEENTDEENTDDALERPASKSNEE